MTSDHHHQNEDTDTKAKIRPRTKMGPLTKCKPKLTDVVALAGDRRR